MTENPGERCTNPPTRFLRVSAVEARTGLSRSTIYDWLAEGRFPPAIRLSGRVVRWVEAEVEEWIRERMDESRGWDGRADACGEAGAETFGARRQAAEAGRGTASRARSQRPGTSRSAASKAGEPAYPGYNPGAGEGLRPFEPRKTRAAVDCAGGGVAPLPPVAAHPDG